MGTLDETRRIILANLIKYCIKWGILGSERLHFRMVWWILRILSKIVEKTYDNFNLEEIVVSSIKLENVYCSKKLHQIYEKKRERNTLILYIVSDNLRIYSTNGWDWKLHETKFHLQHSSPILSRLLALLRLNGMCSLGVRKNQIITMWHVKRSEHCNFLVLWHQSSYAVHQSTHWLIILLSLHQTHLSTLSLIDGTIFSQLEWTLLLNHVRLLSPVHTCTLYCSCMVSKWFI